MNAYIVAGYRTAVGRAPKGLFRFTRPDDLGIAVIKHLMAQVPSITPEMVNDLIVGNALPEAEQGLNFARYIALGSLGTTVPAVTINRYCASGLEAIAMASSKIHAGHADVIVAGGAESMSLIPMGGWKISPNPELASIHPDYYLGMGNTAEAVAEKFNINRADSDEFAYNSHMKAIAAQESGKFKDEIVPVVVKENYLDENGKKKTKEYTVADDEGPRRDTSVDKLAKLKPVFHAKGVVTAGNSSPTNDGAAFVLVVSERILKEHNLTPIARLAGYSVAGVEPRIMGIGPVAAIPTALKTAGISLNQVDVIELNEAFAAQSLAVVREAGLDPSKVNPNGGAIALGHPLGCSGAKLSVQLFNELKRRNGKYGIVSACVGGGQGIAGVYEMLN